MQVDHHEFGWLEAADVTNPTFCTIYKVLFHTNCGLEAKQCIVPFLVVPSLYESFATLSGQYAVQRAYVRSTRCHQCKCDEEPVIWQNLSRYLCHSHRGSSHPQIRFPLLL